MLRFSRHLISDKGARQRAIHDALAVQQVRKAASELSDQEQRTFKSAITQAISAGIYSRIVWNHADMRHRQHSMGGPIGTLRFLPWHRDYLLKFEDALRPFEPNFIVPYWDWTAEREIPAWLVDFTPSGVRDLNGNEIEIQRSPNSPDQLPSKDDIAGVLQKDTYLTFTRLLEGIHNGVHNWVGGIMDNLMYSPSDPIFWMHHAQIDRVWWTWEAKFPQQEPALQGPDAALDP